MKIITDVYRTNPVAGDSLDMPIEFEWTERKDKIMFTINGDKNMTFAIRLEYLVGVTDAARVGTVL